MRLRTWGATDVGRKRKDNQDAFLVDTDVGLAVVADGVGGQARGDVASTLAVRVVREHLRWEHARLETFRRDGDRRAREDVMDTLREAVQMASAQVFRAGETLAGGRGMACTLDVLLVLRRTGFLAHVGDSRIYVIRKRTSFQLTEDHSVLQEKLRRGLLTQEEAESSRGKNVITRAVGSMPSVKVDLLAMPVYEGDRFVLCSDGLTRYVRDDELPGMLDPFDDRTPARLVALANERGGADNITAVVAEVEEEGPFDHPTTAAQLAVLRRFPLLEKLTYRELAILGSVLEQASLKPGRLLFREGEPGHELYLLVEGEVVITRAGTHLSTIGALECFGEMALLDAPARSASALVSKPSQVLILRRDRLTQLLEEHEGLSVRILWTLLATLSARIRSLNVIGPKPEDPD